MTVMYSVSRWWWHRQTTSDC